MTAQPWSAAIARSASHDGPAAEARPVGGGLSGLFLVLGRDGVLQVDDDQVRTAAGGLVEAVRAVAGHEEQGSGGRYEQGLFLGPVDVRAHAKVTSAVACRASR
jgi:hypothetical protein